MLVTAPIVPLPDVSDFIASTTEWATPWFETVFPWIIPVVALAFVGWLLARLTGIFDH